jgi:hypothetical protein
MKLRPIPGGRWAIGRECFNGYFIGLIENTAIDHEFETELVLQTLGLAYTEEMLDLYFPQNRESQRCPTFALMSLWYDLSPANVADSANRV